MRIRTFLASTLLAAALFPARGDGVRLAVLAPGDPDGGALLEAELGKRPGVALVERTEIERVFREQALGAVSAVSASSGIATGKLLHADALVIVSRDTSTDTPLETARLVAVQPGVVIDSAVLAPDRAILSAEVSRIADQFEPLLRKAGTLDPSSAVKVSLLGLHFELNSPVASGTERTLNTLLANRLTHRPRIVVLERWNLNAAAWEKDLQPGDPAPFWTGSCLIDGRLRLVAPGNQIAVEMRLRPPSGPPLSISVTAPADRIAELADTLADRVAASRNAPEAALSWDRKEEALNETLLAHWALGNQLYRDAFEAVATADALCPRTPDIDLLRLECETQLAFPRPPFVDTRTWTPYEAGRDGVPELPAQLDAAQIALDHLRLLWTLADDDPAYQPAAARIRTQAVYTVQQASRLLSAAWAQASWKSDEGGFAELRQKLREMVDLFLQQDASYQVRVGARLLAFAPYWFETPADTLAFYQRMARLPSNPAFPSPLAYGPSRWDGARSWLVGWHGEKQPELAATWKAFLDTMQASPSLPDQIAGAVWRVRSVPNSSARAALLPGLADFAWNHRADVVRTDNPVDLSPVGEALADHGWRGADKDDPALQRLAAGFLPSLFQTGLWIRPRTLHAFGLVTTQIAAKEDTAKIAAQFAAYRTAMTGSPFWTASAGYALDRVSRDVFGSTAGDVAEDIRFAARFESLAGDDGQAANVRDPVAAEGRVWFMDNRLHRILGWDPLGNDPISISYPEVLINHFPANLAVGSRYLFIQSEGQVWEYDRSTQIWTHLDLPPARYSPATAGAHAALLSWESTGEKEGGGLLSVDPATHAVETVLSGRSNPPRNDLDGKPDSRGLSLHLTEDGRMDYVVKLSNSNETMGLRAWGDCRDDFYTQRQPGGPWERVLSVTSTFARICHLDWRPASQGALLLTRFRLGATALSSFGQLIVWDRDSGKMTLLLSNPATDRPPLPGVAQWEMPPDLACTDATPHVWIVPALRNGTLWLLRWEGLEKQGMQRPEVYRFRPGAARGERLALDFDPTLGIPDTGNKREGRFLRPESVAIHASGFVLDRSPEWGVWYLPFSEMETALDAAQRPSDSLSSSK